MEVREMRNKGTINQKVERMTVMVCCPIQNREKILFRYLDSIYNLDYPKDQIGLVFLENNSTDRTLALLDDFKFLNEQEYDRIDIIKVNTDFVDGLFNRGNFNAFATLRNELVDWLDPGDTHMFSIDSDVLVPSHTLKQLLGNDKDICSILVDNGKGFYNVLNWNDEKRLYVWCHPVKRELNQIDVTGAAWLIKRDVFNSGVRWGPSKQGEDVFFCEKAKANGFEIWNDGRCEADHLKWDGELWDYEF